MSHDLIGGIILVGSPVWCWAYVRFNRKVLRGDYDDQA